jgi:acetylornithine deacetylase
MTADLSPVLDILERLIACPTVSDRSNKDLIQYADGYLTGLGVKTQVFPSDCGQKFGLIAHIGPNQPGGVLLSGLTDVVPAPEQAWTSSPWRLTERDGKYFGRGTCDMKGFLALALAAVPDMLSAPLIRPIQLAFSFDEEIGCLGSAPMLEALKAGFPQASAVIVGEPTDWRVVSGHKGGIGLVTRIHGKAAHSSLPDLGVSAIAHATRLIDWHSDTMRACHQSATPDSGFDPGHTTFQVGTITGGTAINIIPDFCRFETDIRFMPAEDPQTWIRAYTALAEQCQTAMQRRAPQASIEVTTTELIPALAPEPHGLAEQIARQLTGDNSENRVSYQTEAGHFQAAGYSTIVCGPGSITQAHQMDEFVSVQQLVQGQQFMKRLVQSCT